MNTLDRQISSAGGLDSSVFLPVQNNWIVVTSFFEKMCAQWKVLWVSGSSATEWMCTLARQ